jgi:hypothetical protein
MEEGPKGEAWRNRNFNHNHQVQGMTTTETRLIKQHNQLRLYNYFDPPRDDLNLAVLPDGRSKVLRLAPTCFRGPRDTLLLADEAHSDP